jgi:hypothetical protein
MVLATTSRPQAGKRDSLNFGLFVSLTLNELFTHVHSPNLKPRFTEK